MSYKQYSKRDAIKNYFPLPNEIFCLGLSTGEIAVYAYLMYCEDRKTFQCHPNYHDGCQVKLQLCCGCFDRVLDMVVPLCGTNSITDLTDWEWPDEEKTADIMKSRLKCGVSRTHHIGRQSRPLGAFQRGRKSSFEGSV